MKKETLIELLTDETLCCKIDTSGSASEHLLGELARIDGHASLTSCLNNLNAWAYPVGDVAAWLIIKP